MPLEVKALEVCYDTAVVLNGASLRSGTGEFVTVVGPNGAGKTTLLRCIAGLIRWERRILRGTKYGDITIKGTVAFDGERIDKLPAYEIARKGLSQNMCRGLLMPNTNTHIRKKPPNRRLFKRRVSFLPHKPAIKDKHKNNDKYAKTPYPTRMNIGMTVNP